MKFHFKTMHQYELYFQVKCSVFLESLDPCAFIQESSKIMTPFHIMHHMNSFIGQLADILNMNNIWQW